MAFDEGLEQFLDVGERVAARQQMIDQFEPAQMCLRINADAAAPLGGSIRPRSW